MTKKEQKIVDRYYKAVDKNTTFLYDVYKSYSHEKARIYKQIYNDYYIKDKHAKDFVIISKNGFYFTCGFRTIYNNKLALIYFSPSAWGQVIYL